MSIVDFQTFLLPETVSTVLPESARKWGRFWSRPISRTLHEIQPWIRFLPSLGRAVVEELSSVAPLSHLLFESTLADLRDSLDRNQIDRCVILSDPARVSNAKLLEFAARDSRLIPGIRMPLPTTHSNGAEREALSAEITESHSLGARILQVHPAADGIPPDSDFYTLQIEAAAKRNWIILIQSGAPKVHLVYRRPDFSEIHRFENWMKNWPNTPFVILRMGFNDPESAMDLAERYPNLYLETSWQPAETIAEAVRRIGSKRVLFGSDWPILGNNQRVGLNRIRDALASQMISPEDSKNILGTSAEEILRRTRE